MGVAASDRVHHPDADGRSCVLIAEHVTRGAPREGARSEPASGAATGGGGPQAPPTRKFVRPTRNSDWAPRPGKPTGRRLPRPGNSPGRPETPTGLPDPEILPGSLDPQRPNTSPDPHEVCNSGRAPRNNRLGEASCLKVPSQAGHVEAENANRQSPVGRIRRCAPGSDAERPRLPRGRPPDDLQTVLCCTAHTCIMAREHAPRNPPLDGFRTWPHGGTSGRRAGQTCSAQARQSVPPRPRRECLAG
jgi:hypothetical protein